jgi:hypothetical protein
MPRRKAGSGLPSFFVRSSHARDSPAPAVQASEPRDVFDVQVGLADKSTFGMQPYRTESFGPSAPAACRPGHVGSRKSASARPSGPRALALHRPEVGVQRDSGSRVRPADLGRVLRKEAGLVAALLLTVPVVGNLRLPRHRVLPVLAKLSR